MALSQTLGGLLARAVLLFSVALLAGPLHEAIAQGDLAEAT